MIKEMFDISRETATVTRYSQSKLIRDESVMEHIGSVAFFCLIIGRELKADGHEISMEKLLSKAIIHDVEESKIGDIASPVKHNNYNVRHALEDIACFEMDSMFEFCSPSVEDYIIHNWKHSKNSTLEGRILRLADVLSVIMKLREEVLIYRNHSMIDHAENTKMGLERLASDHENRFLLEFINEAIVLNDEVTAQKVTK